MKRLFKTLMLLAPVILLTSQARANLGDTEAQSLNRYGKEFYSAAIASGMLRLYYTTDRKYLVEQLFTHAEVVETVCYIKMGNAAHDPLPLTQTEMKELELVNLPTGTTFPATTVALGKDAENEKVWKSDNGQFYRDLGTLPAKDCPFGVSLDCLVFATGPGYDNLQILMNTPEKNHLEPEEKS
jgi:hypothetical protein